MDELKGKKIYTVIGEGIHDGDFFYWDKPKVFSNYEEALAFFRKKVKEENERWCRDYNKIEADLKTNDAYDTTHLYNGDIVCKVVEDRGFISYESYMVGDFGHNNSFIRLNEVIIK